MALQAVAICEVVKTHALGELTKSHDNRADVSTRDSVQRCDEDAPGCAGKHRRMEGQNAEQNGRDKGEARQSNVKEPLWCPAQTLPRNGPRGKNLPNKVKQVEGRDKHNRHPVAKRVRLNLEAERTSVNYILKRTAQQQSV